MANELAYSGSPATESGLTVTASVYSQSGTLVASGISCAEAGSSALYIGNMPAAAAGVYTVKFFAGATYLASGIIAWDGAAEVLPTRLANLDATVSSRLASASYTAAPSASDIWSNATRTLTDKTGFSLSSPQTFDLVGNITGNLSGTVGSVLGSMGTGYGFFVSSAGNRTAKELVFSGDPNIDSGLTVTASVYTQAGMLVQSGIACTESGSTAIYVCDMPSVGSGSYVVQFFSGDNFLGAGDIYWDGQSLSPTPVYTPLPSAIPTSTAQDIIEASLRLLQVLGDDVVLTAKEAMDGLQAMQYMMDSWGLESGLINAVKLETFTLTPGKNPHTWGVGGDFNSTRPNKILATKLRSTQGVDMDLTQIAYDDYSAIRLKTITNTYPQYLYCDFATGLSNIYLYPVPSSPLTLFTMSEKPLDVPLTLDTILTLPPGWYRALKYNLAVELAPEYQVTAGQDVILLAKESLANVKRQNQRLTTQQEDLALRNAGGIRYNIYRDG